MNNIPSRLLPLALALLTLSGTATAAYQLRMPMKGLVASTPAVVPGLSCQLNGTEVPDGGYILASAAGTVAFGEACQSIERYCSNGVLDGDAAYAFASCSAGLPSACTLNGVTISHDASVTASTTASVAYNATCQSIERHCNNGTLGGSASYAYANCQPAQPLTCTFNNTTIQHGASYQGNAYAAAQVTSPATCQAVTVTCTDGTLSVPNASASCSVVEADASWANVSLLMHMDMDSSFADEKGAVGALRGVGSAAIDTTTVKFGSGAASFAPYATWAFPANAAYALGTGKFSAEMFVKMTSNADSVGLLEYRSDTASGWGAYHWAWTIGSIAGTKMGLRVGNGGSNLDYGAPNLITTGTWHHVAMVRDGDALYFYVDGVQNGSAITLPANLNLDANNPAGTHLRVGYGTRGQLIDEVRLTKGVARHTQNGGVYTYPVPTKALPNN